MIAGFLSVSLLFLDGVQLWLSVILLQISTQDVNTFVGFFAAFYHNELLGRLRGFCSTASAYTYYLAAFTDSMAKNSGKVVEIDECRNCRQQTMTSRDSHGRRQLVSQTSSSSAQRRIRHGCYVIAALVLLCNVIGCQAQRNVKLPPGEFMTY